MRAPRLLGEGKAFYHCVSRVVDRRFAFGPAEKEVIRKIMRRLERFCGVRVLTYCLMSNHFHVLVEVPDREDLEALPEEAMLEALRGLYGPVTMRGIEEELTRAHATKDEARRAERVAEILGRFESRRGDLSIFMKEWKQRVTAYINKKEGRTGTLWEGRFKSVLVEGTEAALQTVAAYVDLNPVRAGIVDSPEEYRWCGYAEAAAGGRQARNGLGMILSESLGEKPLRPDWRRTHGRYRVLLYEEGREVKGDPDAGVSSRRGFDEAAVEKEADRSGKMTIPEVLRHRVRYFSDGVVLGSEGYVDEVFARDRARSGGSRYGPKRETGARRMRGAQWGELRVLRDLQQDVISAPPG